MHALLCKNPLTRRYSCCLGTLGWRDALQRVGLQRNVSGSPFKSSHIPASMPELQSQINLTIQEQELFEELLESSKQAGLAETTLRCAGGWVRDKLMGRESLDIDIALDNMMGKEFAERVNEYLESHGKQTHNVAVIMSNPDQSKHLETARMKIRGMWIDLVNLRSEEYAHNSRIPTMTFGTPEQDAFRRDFTINSLFYNINTKEVEDYTGRGIEDMKLGIIRTPLEARETFLDDPLRVLRAIRFASRFGFALDESLVEAASDEKVRIVFDMSRFWCDLFSGGLQQWSVSG
jgi:tRNA nucleotidyltransferase/poly(A) polymerase